MEVGEAWTGPLLLTVVVLVAVLAVIGIMRPRGGRRGRLPYVRTPALFSAGEREFLHTLQEIAADHAVVLGKVALADIVMPQPGLRAKRREAALDRISDRRVDFVLCDPQDYTVIGVIELDEAGPRGKRVVRDPFLDELLRASGIPLLRVSVRDRDSPETLRELVEDFIHAAPRDFAERREPTLGELPEFTDRRGRREPTVGKPNE
ncbi:MAG: DUF2726 domain-containing protein [Gammaproteobacteria bacterium]